MGLGHSNFLRTEFLSGHVLIFLDGVFNCVGRSKLGSSWASPDEKTRIFESARVLNTLLLQEKPCVSGGLVSRSIWNGIDCTALS